MASDAYFSQKNEAMLQRVLYNDICRRTGNTLNERQAARLMKTVKYYMGEVHRVQGNKPVNTLNSEVLGATLSDYLLYLERSERSDGRSVVSDIEEGPGPQGPQGQQQQQGPQKQLEDRSRQDVGTAFSHLQASRQESKSRPPMQDFRISLQDEGPVPMDVFERIKKDREEEAARVSVTAATGSTTKEETTITTFTQKQTQQTFAEATDVFARGSRRAEEEAEAAFAERERASLQARAAASSQVFAAAPPPDMRGLFMGDRETIDRSRNRNNEGIPTEVRSSGSQLLITREPDTMAYKETELNLFVYSGDRDWVSNSLETRYNFTVNFDPSNLPSGLRLNPTSTVKFRNIVRIEFVKAIVPGEGLDLMVYKTSANAYESDNNMNVLSYPYIQVRIPELDNNVYGTNNSVNSAFGVLQYDANWISDSGIKTQRGFLAMIPKFLKCQKVYSPTPLATLQKLSFRFERPDGTLLSKAPDTLDITQIYPTVAMSGGNGFTNIVNTFYNYDAAVETNASAYYWIQSSKYFNRWTVSKGDRIVVKNLTWPSPQPTGVGITQMSEFLPYIQQDAGLIVVDTGVITGTGLTATFTNSYNSQGYANAIIVRGKFADPETGVFKPVALGGVADNFAATDSLSKYLVNNTLSAGRLLNQTHQVQVSMRVITRELDSTGILRPDNL